MYSNTLTPRFALGVLLLRGALGSPVSTTTTSYAGMWDATLSPTPTQNPTETCLSSSPSATCSRSICVDNVNECGMMYGGCFLDPACTGGTVWPTFSKPPCPSQTCTQSICADYINECGIWYGGCFLDPQCTGGTAWPTFTPPPCPTSSSSTSKSSSSEPCPSPTPYTSSSLIISSTSKYSSSASCSRSICADYTNACGQPYGGCYLDPACTGGTVLPSFSAPPCPTNTLYPTVTAISTIVYITTTRPTGGAVTITQTSTDSSVAPTVAPTVIPTVSVVSNGTQPNATVPTPSAPLFTGAGSRNFAEVGIVAVIVAAGALLL